MKMGKGKDKKKKIIFLSFIAVIIGALVVFYSFNRHNSNDFGTNFVSILIPIGAYLSYDVEH